MNPGGWAFCGENLGLWPCCTKGLFVGEAPGLGYLDAHVVQNRGRDDRVAGARGKYSALDPRSFGDNPNASLVFGLAAVASAKSTVIRRGDDEPFLAGLGFAYFEGGKHFTDLFVHQLDRGGVLGNVDAVSEAVARVVDIVEVEKEYVEGGFLKLSHAANRDCAVGLGIDQEASLAGKRPQ